MILADTSAWVEFDRATGSAIDVALRTAMAGDELAVTEPVLMEMLAGAKDEKRAHDLRELLTSFGWLATDPVADFEGAARIYRQCRAAGFTPRGLVDCMLACIAIRNGAELLTTDRDFERMAGIVPLRLAA